MSSNLARRFLSTIAGTRTGITITMSGNVEVATLGAGCFWGVQHMYDKHFGQRGLKTEVGFAQGHAAQPSYKQVCAGNTNHNEVVRLYYDPAKVTYEEIIHFFFRMHDPTALNRQGPDVGTQYRSGIYYYSPDQKETAERVKAGVQKYFKNPIATEIEPIKEFFSAEEYHQKYLDNNPTGYQCPSHFLREFKN